MVEGQRNNRELTEKYGFSVIMKPAAQVGLAMANIIPSCLLFKHSKGEKPSYALAAGALLIFGGYHIYKAIALARGEEAWLI
jgi:hypothetical protein